MRFSIAFLVCLVASLAHAAITIDRPALSLDVGGAEQLEVSPAVDGATWTSSDPTVAQVYANGFVLGLKHGSATISATISATTPGEPAAVCQVTVTPSHQPLIDPATLKQYPDQRKFTEIFI